MTASRFWKTPWKMIYLIYDSFPISSFMNLRRYCSQILGNSFHSFLIVKGQFSDL